MDELERVRRLIALKHVEEEGDAQTRELVDRLREDRAAALRDRESLHGEIAALQHNVLDAYRSGLSPGARHVVGLGLMALGNLCKSRNRRAIFAL